MFQYTTKKKLRNRNTGTPNDKNGNKAKFSWSGILPSFLIVTKWNGIHFTSLVLVKPLTLVVFSKGVESFLTFATNMVLVKTVMSNRMDIYTSSASQMVLCSH